jgi:outer membrane protein TolC
MVRVTRTVPTAGIALLFLFGISPLTFAQPPITPVGAGDREAPVIRFDPQGIDLAQAVSLTLQNSPDIRLAEANATGALGFAQQQMGLFDTSFFGNSNYNYQRQELRPTDFLGEQLKRSNLVTQRDQQTGTADKLNTLAQQLQVIAGLPTECGTARISQEIALIRLLDAQTASDLEVVDALCGSANAVDPSQKLRSDLLAARQRMITDTISRARTGASSAQAGFERLNRLVVNLGATPEQEYFANGAFNLSLSRLFRNGISVSPFFNGTGNSTNFIDKPFNADCEIGPCGGKGALPLYNVQSGFHAFIPLARGLGAASTAAPERAALIGEQAAQLDAQHQASVSALTTINAYWSLRGAQENVDIAQRSVDLQGRIVQLTRQTIAAGNLPAIELARVQASEARSQTTLRDAQVALQQARVGLATAMGIAVSSDDATLPKASDAFPAPPDAGAVDEQKMTALATDGLQQRRDVTAALRRAEAAQVAVRGAQLDLKPRIDLTGGSWWTGNDEDVITNALKRWVGPSYNLAIDVEKPFGNNTQRGLLVEAQAGGASSQISSADLRRQVRLDVVRTGRSIVEAIERVRIAQSAVQFYQQTIDGELARYQIGEVTLIDTITTESQQADARRALVAAQQELAQLIAELRFETGTLVPDARSPVTPANLITLPR